MPTHLISRKHIATVLKIVVGAALIYFVLRQADANALAQIVRRLSPLGFLASAACLMVAVALNALRWSIVLKLLGTPLSRITALLGTFEGMFFNLFLPTGVGGDAMRAYRAFDRGATAPVAIESTLIDRAFGLWALGLTLLVAAPFAAIVPKVPSSALLLLFSGAIVLGGIVVAVVGRLIDPSRFTSWIRPIADLFHNYGRVLFSSGFVRGILPALAASSLLASSTIWLLTRSLGLDLSWFDMVIVMQASSLAALLPVSFGGWGVREGITVFLLTRADVGPNEAVAVSILYGAILLIVGLVGAIGWMTSPYRGIARFSDMRLGRRAAAAAAVNIPDHKPE